MESSLFKTDRGSGAAAFIGSLRSRFPMLAKKSLFWGLVLNISIIIILILYIIIKIKPGLDITVLRYNVLTGVEQRDRGVYIFQLPLLSAVVLGVNLLLARIFFNFEDFAATLLVYASAAVAAIFLMAAISIGFLF